MHVRVKKRVILACDVVVEARRFRIRKRRLVELHTSTPSLLRVTAEDGNERRGGKPK